jgi:hypothetical protein
MPVPSDPGTDPVARAHRGLRRGLGWLGFALPSLLLVLPAPLGLEVGAYRGSISEHYYAPNLGALFVGALWAIGSFLVYYRGHPPERPAYILPVLCNPAGEWLVRHVSDRLVTTLAGIGALGTAMVPTEPETGPCAPTLCSEGLHLAFAAVFFLASAYMTLVQFTQSREPPARWAAGKRRSNRIYIGCGAVMLASMALIAVHLALWPLPIPGHPVFLLEAVAVWAFALAWLVKGDAAEPVTRRLRQVLAARRS